MKKLKSIFLFAFLLLSFAGATSCTDEGAVSLIDVSITCSKTSIFTGESIDLTADVKWKDTQPAGYTTTEKWKITNDESCVDSSESADSKTLTLTGKLHSNAVKVTLTVEVINGKGKRSGSVTKDVTITIKARLDSSTVDPNVKSFLTDDKKAAATTYQAKPSDAVNIASDGTITVNTTNTTVIITVFDADGKQIDEFTLEISGHVHSYGSEWQYDTSGHWKDFTCESDPEHSSSSVNPTFKPHTLVNGKCSVCGFTTPPEDAIGGLFTIGVDANGKKRRIYFSKGSLQATYNSQTRSYTWGFSQKQYDRYVDNNWYQKINNPQDGDIVDLFEWSDDNSSYGLVVRDLAVDNVVRGNTFKDWGDMVNNSSSTWRTLTLDEARVLIGGVQVANSDIRKNKVLTRNINVNGNSVSGIVFLPDAWSGFPQGLDTKQTFEIEDWEAMESKGAVFMPIAYRLKNGSYDSNTSQGGYWLSTPRTDGISEDDINKYVDFIYSTGSNDIYLSYNNVCAGYMVRLVTEV